MSHAFSRFFIMLWELTQRAIAFLQAVDWIYDSDSMKKWIFKMYRPGLQNIDHLCHHYIRQQSKKLRYGLNIEARVPTLGLLHGPVQEVIGLGSFCWILKGFCWNLGAFVEALFLLWCLAAFQSVGWVFQALLFLGIWSSLQCICQCWSFPIFSLCSRSNCADCRIRTGV